ncbi:hypothetical protein [Mycobacteroides saopaulense]|uniref:Uncharacterized protein n=1 Tax=Mycobacteroides saopaulense TaxID=1578165 RepID=A0ABX3C6G3_9MYCO|nr:hypothetical protein [Mycobacteroides saopaulense]OHT89199.1 hypothetical protein BKG68_05040 [Mycobacteroides saopaulense]OHU14020.1 hypothetical protein BKG73_05050 [Mycobacteroides saopaulense]
MNWGDLEHYPMWVSVWGTVGQWVSGLISAGALLLALHILLRDRNIRQRAQADKVACWLEFSEHDDAAVHLINTSDMPIFRPTVTAIPKYPWLVWFWRWRRPCFHTNKNPAKGDHRDYAQLDFKPYTQGIQIDKDEYQMQPLGLRYSFRLYVVCVEFRDASNQRWIRNLSTGKYVGRRYRLRRWIACRRALPPTRHTGI